MNTPEIDQIVEYTKKFIEAATPIARQAYELGLLTLRIDAISTLVPTLVVLVAVFFVFRKIAADWRVASAKRDESSKSYLNVTYFLPGSGFPHIIGGFAAAVCGVISAIVLLDVWLYVKLFAPELWLAHMAVQKIVG